MQLLARHCGRRTPVVVNILGHSDKLRAVVVAVVVNILGEWDKLRAVVVAVVVLSPLLFLPSFRHARETDRIARRCGHVQSMAHVALDGSS